MIEIFCEKIKSLKNVLIRKKNSFEKKRKKFIYFDKNNIRKYYIKKKC